jgi:DNA-binding Xre family transcriptional regulator
MHRLKIRQIAESRGISRTRLSRLAEIQYDTVNAIWHNDTRDITLSTLIKIAKALHIDVSELYEVIDDPRLPPSW